MRIIFGFEFAEVPAPFGTIYSLVVFFQLLKIDSCIGSKHSSLDRSLEWQRLELRNQQRTDFQICTGNDLAIDRVMCDDDWSVLIEEYAAPAVLGVKSGFSFVDIKHRHGYFGHELLGDYDRSGKFGGSFGWRGSQVRWLPEKNLSDVQRLHDGTVKWHCEWLLSARSFLWKAARARPFESGKENRIVFYLESFQRKYYSIGKGCERRRCLGDSSWVWLILEGGWTK